MPRGAILAAPLTNLRDSAAAAAAATQSAQRQAKLASCDQVEEEVARVVRQTDLVNDLGDGVVDDEATPRRHVRVLLRGTCIASRRDVGGRDDVIHACAAVVGRPHFRKRVAQYVDDGGR